MGKTCFLVDTKDLNGRSNDPFVGTGGIALVCTVGKQSYSKRKFASSGAFEGPFSISLSLPLTFSFRIVLIYALLLLLSLVRMARTPAQVFV